MIALLLGVSVPYLRENRYRLLLTLLGVVIGVQGMVAMAILNRSIIQSFKAGVEAIAGDASLQIVGPETGIPEELVGEAQEVAGVAFATALVQGAFQMASHPTERIAVFGLDLLEQVGRRNPQFPKEHVHIKHELSFLNATDSIALGATFLKRHDLSIGSTIQLITPIGLQTFVVRGSLDHIGPAKLYDGNIGLLDLPNAQARFLEPGLVQAIFVTVSPQFDADEVASLLRAQIGGRARVERTEIRGQQMDALLGSLRVALSLASFVTMIAAFFIIYQTVAISVEQRRRSIAIIRTLGFGRKSVTGLFLFEALTLGILGGLGGIAGGYLLARLSLQTAVQGIADNYIHVPVGNVAVPPTDTAIAVVLGIATCLLAAIVPVRRAASDAPAQVLRSTAGISAERPRIRSLIAAGLAISVAMVALAADPSFDSSAARTIWIAIGHGLLIASMSILAPFVVHACAVAARSAVRHGPFVAELAVEFFSRRPRRAAATTSAIMVGYALVVVLGSVVHSIAATMNRWLDHTHGSDVLVGTPPSLTSGSFHQELATALSEIPGVRYAERYRGTMHLVDGKPIVLIAFDRRNRPDGSPLLLVDSLTDPYDRAAGAEGIFVSEGFAFRFGYALGDPITLSTAFGERTFSVAAIVRDYTFDLGSVFVDIDVYQRLWQDFRLTRTNLWSAPGADLQRIRRESAALVANDPRITVMTNEEFRADILTRVRALLRVLGSIQVLACAIAMLGVVNLLWAATLDRRREIALLRSVGVTRKQIRQALVVEATLLAIAGVSLGIATGLSSGFFMVTHSIRVDTGWTLGFSFPWALSVSTGVAVLVAAAVAGYLPSQRITREAVTSGLSVE